MKTKKILLIVSAIVAIFGAIHMSYYQKGTPMGVTMFVSGLIFVLIILFGSPYKSEKDDDKTLESQKTLKKVSIILITIGVVLPVASLVWVKAMNEKSFEIQGSGAICIIGIILLIVGGIIDPDEIEEEDTGFGA